MRAAVGLHIDFGVDQVKMTMYETFRHHPSSLLTCTANTGLEKKSVSHSPQRNVITPMKKLLHVSKSPIVVEEGYAHTPGTYPFFFVLRFADTL